MTTHETPDLEIRSFQVRATDPENRELTGLAVPYNQPTDIGRYYREAFAPGSVQLQDGGKLFWQHTDPIGRITDSRETNEGFEITARISETVRGDEAYTLLRDGVIDQMSVGFRPVEQTETTGEDDVLTITRTKVNVFEVSLVPFPAYAGAKVHEVRNNQTETEHETMPETPNVDLTEIREHLTDLTRTVSVIDQRTAEFGESGGEPLDTRSAGELLKAMVVDGDDTAIRSYNETLERAYVGGSTADTVMSNGWVGDLTRLVNEAAGVRALFATGTLPKEGNFLEYGQLETDTTQVDEQVDEGDDLTQGQVKITTETAPVKTFGGYSRLSRKMIERSSVRILDTTLRAQANAAGRALNTYFRSRYAAAVTAQRSASNTVDVPDAGDTYQDWLDAVVDAAIKFEDMGLPLDALVVDPTYFKAFNRFQGDDGRPMFTVSGTGANTIGNLNVKTLQGDLASIPVRLNAKQSTPGAAFINENALRTYASPVARLQDENVVNLSQEFSVYFYAAVADETPAGIVPVKRTA